MLSFYSPSITESFKPGCSRNRRPKIRRVWGVFFHHHLRQPPPPPPPHPCKGTCSTARRSPVLGFSCSRLASSSSPTAKGQFPALQHAKIIARYTALFVHTAGTERISLSSENASFVCINEKQNFGRVWDRWVGGGGTEGRNVQREKDESTSNKY